MADENSSKEKERSLRMDDFVASLALKKITRGTPFPKERGRKRPEHSDAREPPASCPPEQRAEYG